jgi:hypothetical protein
MLVTTHGMWRNRIDRGLPYFNSIAEAPPPQPDGKASDPDDSLQVTNVDPTGPQRSKVNNISYENALIEQPIVENT